jgi:hypothetical protein
MKHFLIIFTVSSILTLDLTNFSTSKVTSQQTNSIVSQTSLAIERSNITVNHSQTVKTIDNDIPNTADGKKFLSIVEYATQNRLDRQPLGNIITSIGNKFIGAEYRVGLLDKTPTEQLFISLQKFDCLLFVEIILALAKNISQQDYSYQNFTEMVSQERYRDGTIKNYCSRLHYFSEWIADNQKRGNIINITNSLGGIELPKTLNYMSRNWHKYPATIRTPENYQCIVKMEANLVGVKLEYIPQKDIDKIYPLLQTGDIIGVATNIEGLDVTHTGFVNIVSQDDRQTIGFLHASPAGKVTIAPDLKTYVGKVKNAIGIIVVRGYGN